MGHCIALANIVFLLANTAATSQVNMFCGKKKRFNFPQASWNNAAFA